MTDGHFQSRTFLDDLTQFGHLCVSVCQCDGEDDAALLHEFEHAHHLVGIEHYPLFVGDDTVGGDGDAWEPAVDEVGGLGVEAWMQVVGHAADEEAVVVLPAHDVEVFVLLSVDEFLNDDGGRHLRVVHVGDEHLGGVATVYHEGGQHLSFLTEEHGPSVGQGGNPHPIPRGVLA